MYQIFNFYIFPILRELFRELVILKFKFFLSSSSATLNQIGPSLEDLNTSRYIYSKINFGNFIFNTVLDFGQAYEFFIFICWRRTNIRSLNLYISNKDGFIGKLAFNLDSNSGFSDREVNSLNTRGSVRNSFVYQSIFEIKSNALSKSSTCKS